jgi:hypothetical protein
VQQELCNLDFYCRYSYTTIAVVCRLPVWQVALRSWLQLHETAGEWQRDSVQNARQTGQTLLQRAFVSLVRDPRNSERGCAVLCLCTCGSDT